MKVAYLFANNYQGSLQSDAQLWIVLYICLQIFAYGQQALRSSKVAESSCRVKVFDDDLFNRRNQLEAGQVGN